jgi:MFS transporter, PPP family, 3-phenylpropionic acid transporter
MRDNKTFAVPRLIPKPYFCAMQVRIVKLIYFLLYSAFASWLSFFYVFLKDEPGLSGMEIGSIAAIQQISSIFIVPIWGFLADRYGRRNVFMLSLLLSSAAILGFMHHGGFAFYLFFMLAFTFVYNPLTSLVDSIALDCAEQYQGVNYGQLRLWASIGWAVSALGTGYLLNYTGIWFIFPLASSILAATLLVVLLAYKPIKPNNLPKALSVKLVSDILKGSPQLVFFLFLIVAFTMFSAPIHLFISLYYEEIGASSQQMGLAFAVQSVCELPFFFYGNAIVQRYGIKRTFLFTMAVTAIRMLLYGLISNPYAAIAIGTSHGICLALFLVCMVSFVHRIVPPELKSTGQSMIYTAFAAGICIGNLLTGYINDAASIQDAMKLFSAAIILITVATAVFTPKIQALRRKI